jgi:urea transporter/murein DD-endopeptidase MepM/ murein hydrolase activator NlpD
MYLNILNKEYTKESVIPALINSYSVIFFLDNKLFGLALIIATFLNPFAGICGLVSVLTAIIIAGLLKFDKFQIKSGILSYNALLTGLAIGTFFTPGLVCYILLIVASFLSLLFSVVMAGWLFKYNLPFISIPFIIAFWIIVLPLPFFNNLGLANNDLFWLSNNYLYPAIHQAAPSEFTFVHLVDTYFRSFSSVFFQSNVYTGILIAVALLFSSRIMFTLSVIGFIPAYLLTLLSGPEIGMINYYNIGANYMMITFAIGGFYMIPSASSYLWSLILIPVTCIFVLFLTGIFGLSQLPVFSLPFAVTTILFLYFMYQRKAEKGLITTKIQYYSPEKNLYSYKNDKYRYERFMYLPVYLPFWGEWSVYQGYDGKYTHKNEWGKALDFNILDETGKSFRSTGLKCSDYYCYEKPILAPADGYVEDICDGLEDNEPGTVNTINNWGNSIVIRHLPGVYSQLSHLKKNSFKVTKGSFVKQGEIIALCGNSGRSPEPHLHLQFQSYPVIGSRTIEYPVSYYNIRANGTKQLQQFKVPVEGSIVSGFNVKQIIYNAFNFVPESTIRCKSKNEKGIEIIEHWDSFTDAYNYKYLHCRENGAIAYFIADHSMFYFTAFYGNRKSLLYHFYLSAYKVSFSDEISEVSDTIPSGIISVFRLENRLNDFIAPFSNKISVTYDIKNDENFNEGFRFLSEISIKKRDKKIRVSQSSITISDKGISGFMFESEKMIIEATCESI